MISLGSLDLSEYIPAWHNLAVVVAFESSYFPRSYSPALQRVYLNRVGRYKTTKIASVKLLIFTDFHLILSRSTLVGGSVM